MPLPAIYQFVFIDSTIDDIEHLLNDVSLNISPNAAIVVIDGRQDGIEQISEVLAAYRDNACGDSACGNNACGDIESIHVISHGQAGLVQLGSTQLSSATLDRYANQLQQWTSRSANTEILLYGCEVAATAAGKEFVRQLAAFTGAKVAASTTPVGNAKLGGDWQLDFATASVRSALAFTPSAMASYEFAFNLLPNLIYSVSGNTLHYTSITGGGNFVPVSPTTGLPVNNTLAFATNAIARDHLSANQVLYYISNASNRLGAWDPVTGTATDIAAITGTGNPNLQSAARMAFRDNGQLYVMINNNLHTVSTGSGLGVGNSTPAGTTTLVATISGSALGNGGDMAFDPVNPNILYITGGGSAPNLYRVTFTGNTPSAPTLVGSIGFSSSGLAFGPDGNLYGSNGTRLVRISTINGSPTDIGQIGSVNVSDFATLPTPSPDVDLSISVTDSQVTVAPNGAITYTITVRNNSPYALRGISIVDAFSDPSLAGTPNWSAPLSAGVTFPTAADQSGTGNINVKVNLAAGATVTYTVTGLTAKNTPGATITNTATVAPPEGYTDKASNPGANSATDLTTINIIDTTPPVVTVTPLTTADGTPQLTGTIDDPTATIKVTVNGVEYTATNNGNGTWTLADNTITTPLPTGTYDVKVTATDTLGNTGSDTTTNELVVDRTPPIVTVNSLTTADSTPQLTGTVDDPTATVKVTVNGVEYTATNNGNGTWTLADNTITTPLPSGAYDVAVTATDTLGNIGSDTTTNELIVDTISPVVTVNLLTTNDGTPQLTGTIDDPTATLKVTVNGIEYTAINNGNGTWTLPNDTIATPLPSGTYDVQVTATDALGNSGSDTTTNELVVDRTPPIVTVNPLTTADSTPQLTGTVDDPTATVKVTVNGVEYTATNNGNGTWTLADNTITTPLPSETYDVAVTATDILGNISSDTTTDELIVDTTPPVVTVTPLTTADGTPQLTGTIDDPTATIKVTVNGVEYTATNNGNGTWTLADNTITTPLPTGTYDVKVTATDTLGNTGSDTTTNELVVDRTPPIVTVNSLTTADSTPQLTGTVDDPTATVKVTVNGVEYTATNNGNGTWTLPNNAITIPLFNGTYDVEVTATDTLGNIGSDTTTDELVIKTTFPTVTVNPLTTADATPQLTGTVDDPTAMVKVTVNGVEYTATNNGNGTWTLPNDTIATPLPSGAYDVEVTATDTLGNIGSDATTNELIVDTISPVVTVNPLTTADSTPQLTGTVDDPTAIVKVTVNGIEYTAINNGNGTWTLPNDTIATPLPSGAYDVEVTATDTLGNTGSDATTNELIVDTVPPVVTVNSLTTADSTPQLTGTIDDPTATLKVTVNGVEYTATNNGNGTWTLADNTITTPLLSGAYDVEVTATDALGNSGSDATTNELIVDTISPVVTVNPLTTADSTPQLTGTVDDPTAIVKVTVNGVEYTATNNGNGTWTLADNTIGTALLDGIYDVKAIATDALGNAGQDSTTNELVINSKIPFVLLTLLDSNTGEDGSTGKFQAVLTSKPTANVTLSFSSSNPSEGVPTVTTFTFTPDNWNTPQIVTVQGKDDTIADGNVTYQIRTSVSSNDSSYHGINVPNITFINIDNDTPGITITPTTNLITSEAGKTATFTILLKSQPTANVVINLVSSDPTEGTVPKSITFTPTNWNRPQTVTITGVDDALIDGDVRYTIQASASSSDPKYSQLSLVSVSVTNLDNDRLNLSPVAKSPTVQVIPGVPVKLTGLSATDPDGSIAAYTITTLPPAKQGSLFLGDPTTGGKAIRSGQTLTPDQIRQLVFLPAPGFTGGSFTYTAMDNSGLTTPPATVSLNLSRTLPPVTSDVNVTLLSNSLTYISNLFATDPDGKIAFYIISTLPDIEQGALFLGEPTRGGTPIQPGQRLTPEQVQQLVFQATDRFSGASFSYSAVDNMGAIDLTPATVTLSASLSELPTCKPGVYLKGTRQKDRLEGTADGDWLRGRNGNDVLHGRGCNDIVLGGRGKDRLFGNAGDDTLRGGVGRDRLRGGSGNDLLNGGRGRDRLFGGMGNDILKGKRHRDRLNGNQGDDRIYGGLGRDRVHGGAGNDIVRGGRGNDRIRGGGGDDRLRGNRGRDRLWGGRGNDLLNGGLRPDRLNGNKGNDTILGGRGNDWLRGRQGDDVLFGGRNRDRLRGQQGHDRLFGGTGKDRLHGGTGNDVLLGGGGKDVLIGGAGSDRFVYTAMNERGDTIRDFTPTEDVIDLSQIFISSRYTNPDRFSNYVELIQQGLNTVVQIDFSGEGQSKKTLVRLENVNANTLGQQHFLV